LAHDAQAKLALIVAQRFYPSVHPSVRVSVCGSLSAALRFSSHIDYRLVIKLLGISSLSTGFVCVCVYRWWVSLCSQWHKAAEACSQSLEVQRLFCRRAAAHIPVPSSVLRRQHRTSQVRFAVILHSGLEYW